MLITDMDNHAVIQRVRAILVTKQHRVLFIKRIKPNNAIPYWVAPGGGVEDHDRNLLAALQRELYEELGATYAVLRHAFTLEHHKANKNLEEHFYLCRLHQIDLSLRHGPEFSDPARGLYIPDEIALTAAAINAINIKTDELRLWLLANLDMLRAL